MKKIFTLAFLAMSTLIFAQGTEGKVRYEEKINVHKHMTGEAAKYKEMVPKYMDDKVELWFNDKIANYAPAKKFNPEDIVQDGMGGRGSMMMRSMKPKSEFFWNFEDNSMVEYREFMSRQFIITGKKPQSWKMTGEQKEIAGYPCMKAETMVDSNSVVAWFTPQLQVKAGPMGANNLPGLVLELAINGDDMVITATEVIIEAVDADKITPPKKGKKLTEEEFKKMAFEKYEEMKQENGGGMRMMH
jgi:GLPGLI family protein